MSITIVCPHCGTPFRIHAKAIKRRKFCSLPCKAQATTRPAEENFWRKVDSSNGPDACWPFLGCIAKKTGYGLFTYRKDGKSIHVLAHRFAYELTYGILLPGFEACHSCDFRPCCNPSHLFPGTQWDNIHDAVSKGRMASGDRNAMRLYPDRVLRGESHGQSKLTPALIQAIFDLKGKMKQRDIAKQFSISKTHVWRIHNQKSWRHLMSA